MTFDEAMHVKCKRCGRDAAHHRMTNSGNFYCPVLNRNGIGLLNGDIRKHNYKPSSVDAIHMPVQYLHRAYFPSSVGKAIKDGLKSFIGTPDMATG